MSYSIKQLLSHCLIAVFSVTILVSCESGQPEPNAHTHQQEKKRTAKEGDTVLVHYTGQLPDGEIFDSTADGQAIPVTIGSKELLPPIEQALIGVNPGELKNISLTANSHPDLASTDTPIASAKSARLIPHSLAGKKLQFEIILVGFESP